MLPKLRVAINAVNDSIAAALNLFAIPRVDREGEVAIIVA